MNHLDYYTLIAFLKVKIRIGKTALLFITILFFNLAEIPYCKKIEPVQRPIQVGSEEPCCFLLKLNPSP